MSPTYKIDGRFILKGKLAEGGMGTVYLAYDKKTREYVVIKYPKFTGKIATDKINIKKLTVERNILKKIKHPYIPPLIYYREISQNDKIVKLQPYLHRLLDNDLQSFVLYIAIKYINGVPLKNIFYNKPGNMELIKKIYPTILEAVEYIHYKNIIHRDIKPKNILVKDNTGYLIDFGTAKYFYEQYHEKIYSPGGYTAPEQLKFNSNQQSDIWSLGAVLFFMVTGKDPIIALPGYPDVIAPPNLSSIIPHDTPEEIVEVITTAMHPNPLYRYSSVTEMKLAFLGKQLKLSGPRIILLSKIIPIKGVEEILLGRYPLPAHSTTNAFEERFFIEKTPEGNYYIKIIDPQRWIGRKHARLFLKNNQWYLQDLGSLNKTAIFENGEWKTIWEGRHKPSEPYPLKEKNIIALAYNKRLGPYLTFTFITK